jgi:hypothetical protein
MKEYVPIKHKVKHQNSSILSWILSLKSLHGLSTLKQGYESEERPMLIKTEVKYEENNIYRKEFKY